MDGGSIGTAKAVMQTDFSRSGEKWRVLKNYFHAVAGIVEHGP